MPRLRLVLLLLLTMPAAAFAQGRAQVIPASHHDVSPPLRDIPPGPSEHGGLEAEPARRIPSKRLATFGPDPVLQAPDPSASALAPAPIINRDGIGNGFTGPNGTFTVNYAPPDTSGAVGPNHYFETVNVSLAVFTKSGTPVYGPVPTNTLWSNFGGNCQIQNDGDAVVEYDSIADRWVITQFQVSTTPFQECVAVSTGPDPTGSYYRYAFPYPDGFPDYPKLSVWPDGYYISYNVFNNSGTLYLYAKACAFDRAKMLIGAAATQQCFNTSSTYGGLLPADLDGATLPAAGAPNPFVALGATNTTLAVWKFHSDFATPANATFTGPIAITVPSYTEACGFSGTCIPQSGGGSLDSLSDRLMYRAAYRNFGTHESIVVNHAVTTGTSVGLRWYELRAVTTTPQLHQAGTFAPDANYRWMGSAAMDQAGNIAIGYSVSSSAIKPQIRYTARLAGDPLGQMTQGEGTIINGAGAQGSGLSRWGDYSSLSVDPVDDCTFWHANEYIPSNGTFNWRTRIASFKLPSCGSTPDFTLSASPSTVTVAQNSSGNSTITVTPTGGFNGSVTLSVSGLPQGASGSFDTNPTSSTSVLTVSVGTATPGTYPFTVTGMSGALTHTVATTLVVPGPDFTLSASPASVTVGPGGSGDTTITVNPSNGFGGTPVTLSASGVPTGASASFSPPTTTTTSVLTLSAGTAAAGTYTVTVTGVSGSLTRTTTVTFTVTASGSFSMSASPSTGSLQRKTSSTFAITVTRSGNFTGPVALSIGGLGNGVTASFNPSTVTGTSSTLTLTASKSAQPGTFTLTITGTTAGLPAATTTIAVTVR
jgi:hypothetical protein